MAKIISTIKAILTRLIFGAHSLMAIWQVTRTKDDILYWTLCGPLILLLGEGVFTVMIKKTQEWRWFCPSVFLYLSSIVPAIWFLELDKVEKRFHRTEINKTTPIVNLSTTPSPDNFSTSSTENLSTPDPLNGLLGKTGIELPINVNTLIEQFLMLILILGRWMLPKGDLTRDQLSQLLLVYIGTAADIMEFFDSYKEEQIAKIQRLVYLTLGIWSWSLMQFTIVLSATRARRPRGSASNQIEEPTNCCNNCCCGIDVWGIVLNVILQDAPFLTFRLLIIFYYRIINYMNVFFTCKNSLVIVLQLYRLYVVNAEFWKSRRERKESTKSRYYKSRRKSDDPNNIYVISSERGTEMKRKIKRVKDYTAEDDYVYTKKPKKDKHKKRKRKDTGYSTASSQNLYSTKLEEKETNDQRRKNKKPKKPGPKRGRSSSPSVSEIVEVKKSKHNKKADKTDKKDKKDKKKSRKIEAVIEETSSSSSSSDSSHSTLPSYEVISEKKSKAKSRRVKPSSSSSSSTDSSDTSSSSESS